jgi:hypothetical protein
MMLKMAVGIDCRYVKESSFVLPLSLDLLLMGCRVLLFRFLSKEPD